MNTNRKKKYSDQILSRINIYSIWAAVSVLWFWLYFGMGASVSQNGIVLGIAMFPFIYRYSLRSFNALNTSFQKQGEQIYSMTLAVLFSDFVSLLIFMLFYGIPTMSEIGAISICLIAQLIIVGIWSFAVYRLKGNKADDEKIKTVVISDDSERTWQKIEDRDMRQFFEIKEVWEFPADRRSIDRLDEFDQIIMDLCDPNERLELIRRALPLDKPTYYMPETDEVALESASRLLMNHLPVSRLENYQPSLEFLFFKRMIDIAVSGTALILLSPVMLITSLLIYLEDKGPVFYGQDRLTKDGKVFRILKFRSMRVDAEASGIRLSSGKNDSRVTAVGKVIRACRIDELPQLLNIIKGDMTLVGPRPERPEIASQYEQTMPEFSLRLQSKAGLTGYAQIYGKYNTDPADKLQMDLIYISKPSILEDFSLLLGTVKILLLPESTEGIAEGSSTAMRKKPNLPSANRSRA